MRSALNSLLLAVTFFVVSAGAQERYPFSGRVLDKKRLDSAHSVVLVDQEKPGPGRLALYIVSNGDNRELLALDAYSEDALGASPVLEAFNASSAYLHFYSDYGMYHGSIKYIFDLFSAKPPVKIRYGILALTSVARENDKLYYSASFVQPRQIFQDGWHAQRATVIVEPSDSELPSYQITDGIVPREEHNFTLDHVGNALYCGSAHGLYLVRGDHITRLRFEPNESGQLAMIPRDVPQPAPVRPSAQSSLRQSRLRWKPHLSLS